MSRMMDLDGVVKSVKSILDRILSDDKKDKRKYAEDEDEE